jgi:hypothetical protein
MAGGWGEERRGGPLYLVRWHDGSRSVFFPAPDDRLIAGDSRRGAFTGV